MAEVRTRHFNSFVFYDSETSGTIENGQYPQIYDLAFIRTDGELNILEESNILFRPRLDINPHPMAFAITRLNIEDLEKKGKPEIDGITEFQNYLLQQPATAMSGYNTGSFDNEVVRHTLYRNLKNAYQHEWAKGNGHVDIYPMIQMAHAYSPNVLEWPIRDDGMVSLKLEDLCAANGIVHEKAHDALSDVRATIQLAKLVRERNPKLWEHSLWLSDKKNAMALMAQHNVLFHTTSYFGKECKMTRPVAPIIVDLKNASQMHCIDLTANPEDIKLLCQMSPDDIRYYLYTKKDDLPEGSPNMPLAKIKANSSPNIIQANAAAIRTRADAFGYSPDVVHKNLATIEENSSILKRIIQEAMVSNFPEPADPYQGMYGSFASKKDEATLQNLHSRDSSNPEKTVLTESTLKEAVAPLMDKKRFGPMILRAKYYNYLEDLMFREKAPFAELKRFFADLTNRAVKGENGCFTFKDFHAELALIRKEHAFDDEQVETLKILEKYMIKKEKEIIPEIQAEIKALGAEGNTALTP